jgi:type I restriction enzyme R subunit
VDISKVMEAVERLLDDSIEARPYAIRETTEPYADRIHLGGLDFEALARYFAKAKHKASLVEAILVSAQQRADILVRLNPTRGNLRDQLELLITEYNVGARNAAQFFPDLLAFLKKLAQEEERTGDEALSREEIAFYDLLLAPKVKLSAKDRDAVKKLACALPKKLTKKLVIDWRKTERARAAVRTTLKDALNDLPDAYGEAVFEQVLASVYEHVYESYWGEGKSKYSE